MRAFAINLLDTVDYMQDKDPDETVWHYENTPIQIYWKFHHQKLEAIR